MYLCIINELFLHDRCVVMKNEDEILLLVDILLKYFPTKTKHDIFEGLSHYCCSGDGKNIHL